MSWAVVEASGSAEDLHHRSMPAGRQVEVLSVDAPTIVLGSTQRAEVVDAAAVEAAGLAVARRRSGGGAVLLVPGEAVWVDVVIPPTDPLWTDDVGRAFLWLGEAWAAAMADLGVPDPSVHQGGLCTTDWSRLVCFGGLGTGEVTSGGRKVVGLSQRRGRDGARFQCTVHRRWDPARLLGALALAPGERSAAVVALGGAVLAVDAEPAAVVAALLAHLPA